LSFALITMEESFKSLLDSARSILILLPTNSNLDTTASGLSLYMALKEGRSVAISASSPITVEFNRLIGINKIATELGNKNLVISFYDYEASDIERVSYDIEDGRFRLTVIPKQGITAPTKEQIKLAYSGVSADTVILIGGASDKHFPSIFSKDLSGAKLIHIGNRELISDPSRGIISFSGMAASLSEVVLSLITEMNLSVNPDIATNLLMGIESATDNYKSPEVTPGTFEITASLMRAGGRRFAAAGLNYENFPPGAIPGQIPLPQTQQSQHKVVKPQTPIMQEEVEESEKLETMEEPPSDWLQPKIYKGTSIS